MLDESRLVSRQEYLVKREEKKLRELVADLEDEAFLFPDAKLTAKELKDLQYKREVLELVKQRDAVAVNDDQYRMPDSYDDAKGRQSKYAPPPLTTTPHSRIKRRRVQVLEGAGCTGCCRFDSLGGYVTLPRRGMQPWAQ